MASRKLWQLWTWEPYDTTEGGWESLCRHRVVATYRSKADADTHCAALEAIRLRYRETRRMGDDDRTAQRRLDPEREYDSYGEEDVYEVAQWKRPQVSTLADFGLDGGRDDG